MSKNDENFITFCDELRAYVEEHHKQLAKSLYSTRNRIVHAKSNYDTTGMEFLLGEMQEANTIMEIIASTIIQWNDRQSETYKIKE